MGWDTLKQPFDDSEIKFKIQAMIGDGIARVVPYVDSRTVIDRLNSSGLHWEDHYTIGSWIDNGSTSWWAQCKLVIDGIEREGFGIGNDPKAAESDALKRAAVKFGIGIELWRSPIIKAAVQNNRISTPREELLAMYHGNDVSVGPVADLVDEGEFTPQPTTTDHGTSKYATKNQVNFVKSLLRQKFPQKKPDIAWEELLAYYGISDGKLTFKAAREILDTLTGKRRWDVGNLFDAWQHGA